MRCRAFGTTVASDNGRSRVMPRILAEGIKRGPLRMLRHAGRTIGVVYLFGTWIYGTLYIWEHRADFSDFAWLTWQAFLRALIWPMWVILDLI